MARARDKRSDTRADALRRAHAHFDARRWHDAYECFEEADGREPLAAVDLERMADAAYLLGMHTAFLDTMERAHRAHKTANELERAARSAFWLGLHNLFRGEVGRGMAWLGRAERLLEAKPPCVEHGYLRLPAVEERMGERDWVGAEAAALEAVAIAARHEDPDLLAMAAQLSGLARLQLGRVREGLAQLDEAMLAATGGELSPRVTGLVYCSVIDGCQRVFAVDRAAQWTEALARWCDTQPSMVSFTGKCMIHRAEILQLGGAWHDALSEARRATERLSQTTDSPADAYYQEGEVLRLRGKLGEAEQAYRNASQAGGDPQPGLSLLRLAQGRHDAARAAIRRVERTTDAPLARGRILPAFVTIMLAGDELDEARRGSEELSRIAERFQTAVLGGLAAVARGEVALAAGDATGALRDLEDAHSVWEQMAMPYQRACTNLLLGRACAALGDEDGRVLRTDAARAGFEQLGAGVEVATLGAAAPHAVSTRAGDLTPRELDVLRCVATGMTNKEVASELSLSVKTVERHLGNIFDKLDVATRAAATAYAHRRGLV